MNNVEPLNDAGLKSYFLNDRKLPLVLSPAHESFDVVDWAARSRGLVRRLLSKYGGILFRDFAVADVSEFQRFMAKAISGNWGEYQEKATPRSHVKGSVYTATEYLNDRTILPHNENSYVTSWPLYIAFYCRVVAATGGETPLVDCRRMLKAIPAEIVTGFSRRGIQYFRAYGYGMGLPWREAFGVSGREEMDRYCARNDIDIRWIGDEQFQLRYHRWATVKHPVTGDAVWFNHGTFFNIHALEPELKEMFLSCYAEHEMPYNTYYGDGAPIEADVVNKLLRVYEQEKVKFRYQPSDVMLLDNMLVAHGREPFTGEREVYVVMMEQMDARRIEGAAEFVGGEHSNRSRRDPVAVD